MAFIGCTIGMVGYCLYAVSSLVTDRVGMLVEC
jgi:hypothetical protein